MVSLISLFRWSKYALSSICVGSLIVLWVLPVGSSFFGEFSPPVGILMFTAPTYSCMWSVAGVRQNGLRHGDTIVWDLKNQQVEKR